MIDGPTFYFNYFQSKNMRHNDCQRFAFNSAVEAQLIHPRLEALGMTKVALPLDTPTAEPHVPIFVSPDLKNKKRVVLIVGESEQELGVIAHRVIGGAGGVDKGSMVDIARALLQNDHDQDKDQTQDKNNANGTTEIDNTVPGLILANTGELWWWPKGGRGLTPRGAQGAPMRSAVHWGRFRDDGPQGGGSNTVLLNGSPTAHVRCVFEQVLGNADLVASDAVVQIVAVGDGAAAAQRVLDGGWARWGGRIGCLAMCGGGLDADSVRDAGFREFLREVSLFSPPIFCKQCRLLVLIFWVANTVLLQQTESPPVHHLSRARRHPHLRARRQREDGPHDGLRHLRL